MILVNKDGEYRRVDDLSIGEYLFNPLADRHCEIVDILSREVEFDAGAEGYAHPLYPVWLRAGLFGIGHPRHGVMVSPSQPVFVAKPSSSAHGTPVTDFETAKNLAGEAEGGDMPKLNRVRYFAVFTETAQKMDVSGVLMSTFCADVYLSDHTVGVSPATRSGTPLQNPLQA